ncbi:hypothetical protein [Butyrivibrio fibrisolvens]|jgi:DNA-nicking Smr family endonuclease|uniref:hypothetical protein n=1 Tax=Butyrivibrio fibrisolvens TaxID=831 RepID=UPI0003B519B8|nr:hypothetical protein [Butyrivibrio fibrisolvens]
MTVDEIRNKLEFVLPGTQMERVNIIARHEDHLPDITLDLHMLKTRDAERTTKNVIAILNEPFNLHIIHGHIHGESIKRMLRNKMSSNKIQEIRPDSWNEGITHISIA